MNSEINYVDISGDSSSKETSPALFQKHGKRKADNKENLPPTSPSLIQTKRLKSNKLEFVSIYIYSLYINKYNFINKFIIISQMK
jgi:hypothetical protein